MKVVFDITLGTNPNNELITFTQYCYEGKQTHMRKKSYAITHDKVIEISHKLGKADRKFSLVGGGFLYVYHRKSITI